MSIVLPLVLILLGPPGSGKGTQAALLKESLHTPHISTGDLLREHIRKETPLGHKAKAFMDEGKLVPDDLIIDMFFERVGQEDCKQGYILDGIPRTLPQAEKLQIYFRKTARVVVINLALSDAKVLERLTKRVICERCGTPYHLIYSPPKEKERCDKCSGRLIQRPDDTEPVIKERLNVYRRQTEPLIAFYSTRRMLRTVECDQPKEKIYSEITGLLDEKISTY